eukprot:RCo048820
MDPPVHLGDLGQAGSSTLQGAYSQTASSHQLFDEPSQIIGYTSDSFAPANQSCNQHLSFSERNYPSPSLAVAAFQDQYPRNSGSLSMEEDSVKCSASGQQQTPLLPTDTGVASERRVTSPSQPVFVCGVPAFHDRAPQVPA